MFAKTFIYHARILVTSFIGPLVLLSLYCLCNGNVHVRYENKKEFLIRYLFSPKSFLCLYVMTFWHTVVMDVYWLAWQNEDVLGSIYVQNT